MPVRNIPLVTDQIYHVFNRGVNRQPTFTSKRNYQQMLLALSYYRFSQPPIRLSRFKELSLARQNETITIMEKDDLKLVDIISFTLMPNHFHLLIKQRQDDGISTYLRKITNSYTRYFNTRNNRVGHLFQGVFKAIRIETNEQLVHVSRYIHLNPLISYCVTTPKELLAYPWSSLPTYLNFSPLNFVEPEPLLSHFLSIKKYQQFVFDQVDYARELEQIKHLILEK